MLATLYILAATACSTTHEKEICVGCDSQPEEEEVETAETGDPSGGSDGTSDYEGPNTSAPSPEGSCHENTVDAACNGESKQTPSFYWELTAEGVAYFVGY